MNSSRSLRLLAQQTLLQRTLQYVRFSFGRWHCQTRPISPALCQGASFCSTAKSATPASLEIDSFKDVQSAIRKVMLFIHPDVMQRYDSKVQSSNQSAVSALLSFIRYAEKAAAAHKATKPISATDPDAAHSLKVYYVPKSHDSSAPDAPRLRSFKYELRAPASLLYRTEVASRKRRDGQLHAEWLHSATAAVQGLLSRLGSDVQLQLSQRHTAFLSEQYAQGQGGAGGRKESRARTVQPSQFAARQMTLQHAYMNDPNTHTDWMPSDRTPLHARSPLSERQVDAVVGRFITKNVRVPQLSPAQRSEVLARLAGCCVRHFAALHLHEAPWRGVTVVVGGAYLAQPQQHTLHIPATFRDADFVLWAQQQYAKMAPGLLQQGLRRGGLHVGDARAATASPHAKGGQGASKADSGSSSPQSDQSDPYAGDGAPSAASSDGPLRAFVAELRRRRAAAPPEPAAER